MVDKSPPGTRKRFVLLMSRNNVAHNFAFCLQELTGHGSVEIGRLAGNRLKPIRDHGLENFGDCLYPYGNNGRPEWTRTFDLFRVNLTRIQVELEVVDGLSKIPFVEHRLLSDYGF
jgi:hypothetical protein